jgi:aerobic-type carbon monoxide dehydrogenase small subunit (CoxS/CutS family)
MSDSEIELIVNGTVRHLQLDPRTSLLDALSEHLQLTGTKKGCNQGAGSIRCMPLAQCSRRSRSTRIWR